MLARLRHHAVVGGDDHQEQVDAGRAGDHRAHEALVAGHVDDRHAPAGRQVEPGVAELDRDSPRPLLRQPIGVRTGERVDQGGLAVIDVTSGAERQRGLGRRGRGVTHRVALRRAAPTRLPRPRPPRRSACAGRAAGGRPARRPTTGGSPARSRAASASAPCAPGRPRPPGPRARAAAARRRRPWRRRVMTSTPPPPIAAASRSARARSSSSAASSIASTGHLAPGAVRVAVEPQRRLQRGERELVDPQRAGERVRARGRDRAARARPSGPACGPPSSLSPEKQTSAAPASTERRTGGSSRSAATPSASAPEPTSSITGGAELAQRLDLDLRDEPERAEVRRVRAQDRAGVLGRSRARSPRAACGWWCRPRPAARPTARPRRGSGRRRRSRPAGRARRRLAPARHRRSAAGREQHRGRAVVDGERRLGAGQLAQQRLDVRVARAAPRRRRGRARGSSSPRAARADRVARGRRPAARGRGWCARSRRSR